MASGLVKKTAIFYPFTLMSCSSALGTIFIRKWLCGCSRSICRSNLRKELSLTESRRPNWISLDHSFLQSLHTQTLWFSHKQNGESSPVFFYRRSIVNFKSHVLIKSYCLLILLVNHHIGNWIKGHGLLYQFLAKTVSAIVSSNKKHFNLLTGNSKKTVY